MNILFLFGILSGLFTIQTSGEKIFQKASEKISCGQDKDSKEKPSFVIHQYIGHDTFTDKAIKGLDRKLKRLIGLLQDKVGIFDNRNRGKALNLFVTFLWALNLEVIYGIWYVKRVRNLWNQHNQFQLTSGHGFSTAIFSGPASSCKEIHEQNRWETLSFTTCWNKNS